MPATAKTGWNLSDYWRTDKSVRQGLELLSVMRGAKGAVSLMGGNYAVQWGRYGSYTSQRTHTIALDIGVLDGIPRPYPGKAVDVVIGLALHEAGHEKWSQDPISLREFHSLNEEERRQFMDTANILEDAYVDHRLREISPALAGYIRAARQALVCQDSMKAVEWIASHPPTQESMSCVWSSISLFEAQVPAKMDNEFRKTLIQLIQITRKYLKVKNKSTRLKKSYETWRDIISKLPTAAAQPPPPLPIELPEGDEEECGKAKKGKGKGKSKSKPKEKEEKEEEEPDEPAELDEQKESSGGSGDESGEKEEEAEDDEEKKEEEEDEAMAKVRENLFRTTGAIYGQGSGLLNLSTVLHNRTISEPDEDDLLQLSNAQHNEQVMREMDKEGVDCKKYVEFESSYDAEGFNRVLSSTQKEIREMRRAFDVLEDVNARWRKALKAGKLDSRRLTKVSCGKTTVFKHRDYKSKTSTAICLILDTSGSMGSQMGIVAEVACIFSQSLRSVKGIWYSTYSYCSDERGDVIMTKMSTSTKQLCLKDVYSSGGTPSGLALSSAVLHLKHRPEKRKLVIHFTDGSPDRPEDIVKALEIADKNRVEILNITSYDKYSEMYKNTKTIQKVSDLPKAIMEMLKTIA